MFSTVLSRSFNHATSLLVLASIAGCFDPSLADSDVEMDGEELTDGENES